MDSKQSNLAIPRRKKIIKISLTFIQLNHINYNVT